VEERRGERTTNNGQGVRLALILHPISVDSLLRLAM
jgi:hypothetical protein